MLTLLHIENIAVVEKTDIEFDRGLNVLTGETGAGKSIVIDSLEAALGWRTSREIVRRGAKNALVTATFSNVDCEEWFSENGIENSDEVVLMRRISEDGKSSCRVNGMPVSTTQLRNLGASLIDIHGQGDGQKLTDERYHRDYLDSFCADQKELDAYVNSYKKLKELQRELDGLSMDESERARRIDTLTYQIDEIERAQITPGEYQEKLARRDLLKSAGRLTGAVAEAVEALYGGDSGNGALDMITSAIGSIEHAMRFSQELSSIYEKLNDLRYSAEDAASDLIDLRDRLDFSPEELDQLDERLDVLKRVFRKYGGSEESVLEYLEEIRAELGDIESSQERIEELEARLEKCRKDTVALAGVLSIRRREGGKKLQKLIVRELQELSMAGADFAVEIKSLDEPGPTGMDDVRFLIAANKGEAMGRISRVASGGELSRVMLAMKTVLADGDSVQSMVFDEIDTGVSGIAAQRVAEKLAAISRTKQVICVTHLPQISAMADTHFSITKSETDGRTSTSVEKLNEAGRKREIARLTGGDNITETSLLAAQEQMDYAAEFKQKINEVND